MPSYLRSGDVAPTWGRGDPRDTRHTAQLCRPDAAASFVLLLLFLVVMYSAIAVTFPVLRPFRPALMLGVGALGLLLVERTLSGQPFRLSWPESHALIAFLGAAALGTFNALWPGLAVQATIGFAKSLVLYLLIVNLVSTRERLRGVIWTIVLAGVMPARGTIQNHLAGNFIEGDRVGWIGKFAGPNEVAFELVILVPLALALMVTARWWGRLLLCGVLGTYLVAIFFTYSRSGILGLAGMVAVGIFRLRSHAIRALAVVVVVSVAAVGLQFWERDETLTGLEDDTTFNQRLDSIQKGLAMFQSSPVFGIGLGCSWLGSDGEFVEAANAQHLGIHNTIVQALAETGLVGLALLTIATLAVLGRMYSLGKGVGFVDQELRAYSTAIELSLVAFLVAGLANGFVLATAPYLLIGLGSATWGVALAEREAERV